MRVEAVVCAHNEAPTVGAVVAALRAAGALARVLVVDDGSTDATAAVARAAGADVLELRPNRGKGAAMRAGVAATRGDAVLFADADLVGLRPAHVQQLVAPVAAGAVVMMCGLRDYGAARNAFHLAPLRITGERCVRRDVLARVPPDFWRGFRIEAGLNAAAARAGPVGAEVLRGLSIRPKWAKGDARAGVERAARMLVEVLAALRDAARLRTR